MKLSPIESCKIPWSFNPKKFCPIVEFQQENATQRYSQVRLLVTNLKLI